ncbi:hypothetical protein F5J12DRAFT_780415 [Pisolithus orientalis]|uniref:uncharacterized protein n=1 Tax=Pisolithus orientalis TaxID=936130 RepID=UPI0022255D90|nr:uncharacterized protein F5J12DRAFT_780415 [Pisolithus orientalis]KAI6028904.1 hypothetical protein F5J12DRAFT_780415 [Pisolithus orientalis]
MSTTNTSTFILAQSTDNIQPVITAENAKQMVKEAASVTMQALRGLWGWDAKHWGKVAQLVWAQLGMVHTVVEHLPPAFEIPLHLIAIDMHMVDLATIFAMQMWPPFNQMMMAREANVKDHAWYCLCHQPKSHPYCKVMEELTRPSLRAKHQAQLVDKGKGKELGMDEAQRTQLPVCEMPGQELALYGASWQGMLAMPLYQILMQLVQGEGRQVQDAAKSLPFKALLATIPRRHGQPSHHFNAGCTSSINQSMSQMSKGTKLKSIHQSIQSNKPSFISWPMDWLPHLMQEVLQQTHPSLQCQLLQPVPMIHAIVTNAIHNHLFPAPDVLNHPLVPFHTTSNPTPVPHMPVMVELGTATGVVEAQSSQSSSRQESTEPPPASFEGGASLEVPPSNVKPVHGPAGGLAISITPPPPAVRSAPGQEGRMEVD